MSTEPEPSIELGSPSDALRAYAADRMETLTAFAEMTAAEGVLRGLIGPREVTRLWDRHIENSAALLTVLPESSALIDVGSGGGFPGIVVAILRPDLMTYLVEPMARRTDWLKEVKRELGLDNVEVYRGRAEQFAGSISAGIVTSRAVARLEKLSTMCFPLVEEGGWMVALKGESAEDELAEAVDTMCEMGAVEWDVREARLPGGMDATRAVLVRKVERG